MVEIVKSEPVEEAVKVNVGPETLLMVVVAEEVAIAQVGLPLTIVKTYPAVLVESRTS